ncbi:MAG: DegT/DnrJ/EryC1/StrS family aminotransferase [Candidatus Lokiarchaeota archaeon]|nr:DegT/DnrJ/EryC1/StrS family aminotransferase [Candidatus Lokiarchaeota archaeon]
MSEESAKKTYELLLSGYIGQGDVVEKFESTLKKHFSNKNVVTTNSATSAEHLVLHMLKKPSDNIKSYYGVAFAESHWDGMSLGDEILTTPLTCTATNWPILANGFNIKWVDVDPNTCNMDLDDLERKITHKTKAIMLVHWGGYPIDLDRLNEIQTKAKTLYGIKPVIIEDCAHAFGSTYKGTKIGSHGNVCTFSFQAIKHLTSGDGGCIVFPYENQAKRAKILRWYGIDRNSNRKDFRCEDDILEYGFKFHMNDINATIGLNNYQSVIDNIIPKHISNATFYNEELKNIPGLTLLENKSDRQSSYWIYTIKVERQQDFMNKMKECGIMVSRVHERNDIHSCVKKYRIDLPNLNSLVKEMICIPVGWWVTPEDRQYIVDCIRGGW